MIPLRNEILFKPFPPSDITLGGLFVPDSCKEVSNKGTIVKVGRGTQKKPMRLKEGMIAHRVKDWGTPIEIDNELYFLMDEASILAIE